ncbi:MAG: GTP-binding protein [Flammeovirgaceae bacterium]|jgi:GTP-binding protein
MQIKKAEFVMSNPDFRQCPESKTPEFAFIGRSNVGKSSLINALTNKKALAKTSGKPGKTRLINHFIINDRWYLVDLPGYGYAQIGKAEREKFEVMIHDYIKHRENLKGVFVLIDSRHEPQKNDTDFMEWLGQNEIPFVIVFTKSDKSRKAGELDRKINKYKSIMLETWEEMPECFITSSEHRKGLDDVLSFIETLI